jgi:subtilisin family serine protease
MAAPHVAGLAALMVEQVGRNPGRVRFSIQGSADDLGARGTDPYYGKGRINIGNAVFR